MDGTPTMVAYMAGFNAGFVWEISRGQYTYTYPLSMA